jgi:hypothetical protein
VTGPRAVYRGYWKDGRRSARVTRLHIIRETGKRPGTQTWCGQGAGLHTNSEPVVLDPMPAVPPDGLSWCPICIGHLAEQTKRMDEVAAILSGAAYSAGEVS